MQVGADGTSGRETVMRMQERGTSRTRLEELRDIHARVLVVDLGGRDARDVLPIDDLELADASRAALRRHTTRGSSDRWSSDRRRCVEHLLKALAE